MKGALVGRILASLSIVTVALSLYGCGGYSGFLQPAGLFASPGLIVTDIHAGSLVLDNGVAPTKEGKACSTQILGVVAQGDNRAETAMNNGGVKKIVYVNHSIKSYVFGVWSEVCTIVRGN